jgi:hypothetical protein
MIPISLTMAEENTARKVAKAARSVQTTEIAVDRYAERSAARPNARSGSNRGIVADFDNVGFDSDPENLRSCIERMPECFRPIACEVRRP